MNNKRFEIGASEQPLDIIKETCGFAGVFKQIGVIGDSLASGEFESHDENGNIVYTDMYEYSWPAVLERITGTKYNNYSRGGMTAREYVQSWADANGFWQWNQAYIIALGNNDSFVFGHPLGSVKDVNAECPQDNADTFRILLIEIQSTVLERHFAGCYGKLGKAVHALSFFFVHIGFWIEAFDFTCDLTGGFLCVKLGDGT